MIELGHGPELRPRIFSAPRRFDLATMFVVSIAYAILFGLLRYLDAHPITVCIVAGYFSLIAAAQALLFKGEKPRLASILAGLSVFVGLQIGVSVYRQVGGKQTIHLGTVGGVMFGVLFGYIGGIVVGSVFLIAHAVRIAIQGRAEINAQDEHDQI